MCMTYEEILQQRKALDAAQAKLQAGCAHKRRRGQVRFGDHYEQHCRDCGKLIKGFAGWFTADEAPTGEWEEDDAVDTARS